MTTETGLRVDLDAFEEEMAERSTSKVEDSAKAAWLLHSHEVLEEEVRINASPNLAGPCEKC